ncbi:hypothetical protein [Tropicimonas marinistellae]|uniref:hypothetical protein n=1 Tax=Tropicimonas marinistellae TaxID=1739787 RepID=UPI000830C2B7|nr:hypothetical protein [Tropicimonas marinistellae]
MSKPGALSLPFTRRKVLVVGTFRSGTNVTQTCLEQYFHTRVVFNEWFWKHGVPPTEIKRPIPRKVPILVMSKDPVELNRSLYRFWQARRPELDVGRNISEFIRRRFIVYDNTGGDSRPRYYFLHPTEYWNQFYFSWLNWKAVSDQRVFLRCEDLMRDPEECLSAFSARFGLQRRGAAPVSLPEGRVGPPVAPETDTDESGLSGEDIDWIRRQVDPEVANALGYAAGEQPGH